MRLTGWHRWTFGTDIGLPGLTERVHTIRDKRDNTIRTFTTLNSLSRSLITEDQHASRQWHEFVCRKHVIAAMAVYKMDLTKKSRSAGAWECLGSAELGPTLGERNESIPRLTTERFYSKKQERRGCCPGRGPAAGEQLVDVFIELPLVRFVFVVLRHPGHPPPVPIIGPEPSLTSFNGRLE
eukprot:scaffold119186_cov34-Prasinocladus_malaysianus.AAC.2